MVRASRLRVRLTDAKGTYDLDVVEDGTAMFTRTGVLRLAIDPRSVAVDDAFTLQIDCPSGEWLVTPLVTRISPNVIPVLQSEQLTWVDVGAGQGVPDQELTLPRPGLQFGGSQALSVRAFENGGWHEWKVVEDFESSGPDDYHVCLFVDSGSIRFGNGVNGRLLEGGAPVQASYSVSQGFKGNLPANMIWTVSGIAGVFGSNPAIMSGGADANVDRDLQIAARVRLNGSRPIVTKADLQEAALSFTDLRVRRAEELIAPAGSDRRVAGERHLLVVGEHVGSDAPQAAEPEAWRREIQARLAPRLPVGQRLEVIAPRYVTVTLRATLVALPRLDVGTIRDSAVANLESRFALSAKPDSPAWPLGRKVTRVMVSAWLRKIAGVARVLEVNLFADGEPIDGEIAIPAAGLPLLRLAPGDIRVLRDGERVAP
jgi:predicted phage baseplate assembly protein